MRVSGAADLVDPLLQLGFLQRAHRQLHEALDASAQGLVGLRKIRLLTNNPRKIAGIHGFGLDVVESVSLAALSKARGNPT